MVKNIKSVGVLVAICSVIALLLALTNQITAPIIEKNSSAAANQALLEVMPNGTGFEQVDLSGHTLPATVTEAYKETSGAGYVIKLTTTGYGPNMVIMCGVDAAGVVTGAVCLSSTETKFVEKTYGENFAGKDADGVGAVDVIAGTTMTTQAYKDAVKDAINTATILGGGQADLRSPEEIFNDNLKTALPEADEFVKQIVADHNAILYTIYAAKNGAGYVYVMNDLFIGINAEGQVITEGILSDTASYAGWIADLAKQHIAIDTAGTGINENITSVQKNAEGNYVIEVNGLGFAYKGDPSHYLQGKEIPIKIGLVIAPNATVVKCVTLEHQESAGYGAACGEESFYSQFDGVVADTIKDVDAIAGATVTTSGYKAAVRAALTAVTILEGGAE